jgi:hypothetical protein
MRKSLVGKRSSFKRIPRDYYPTPYEAVIPLLSHLKPNTIYAEPCAGAGDLIDHLDRHGHTCIDATDIEPRRGDIIEADALASRYAGNGEFLDCLITNPPWSRPILHEIIVNLSYQAPTWLLFDADWPHTRQATRYLPLLRKIVAVGRIKWIPDSKFTGKDNCCWYLFDADKTGPIEFVGRPE